MFQKPFIGIVYIGWFDEYLNFLMISRPEPEILFNIQFYIHVCIHILYLCRRWLWISRNDSLWRMKIRETLPEAATHCLSPGTSSWIEEYRRLVSHVPGHPDSDLVRQHYGGVCQLTMSSDGQMMASCGEDARLCHDH